MHCAYRRVGTTFLAPRRNKYDCTNFCRCLLRILYGYENRPLCNGRIYSLGRLLCSRVFFFYGRICSAVRSERRLCIRIFAVCGYCFVMEKTSPAHGICGADCLLPFGNNVVCLCFGTDFFRIGTFNLPALCLKRCFIGCRCLFWGKKRKKTVAENKKYELK